MAGGSGLGALYHWVAPRATPRAVAIGGLLWLTSALGAVALQSRVAARSGGRTVPDVEPFYGPADLYVLLESYGAPAREAFFDFTLYDVYYPFVAYRMATLALVSLTRSTIDVHPRLAWVLAVPIGGLVVELLEQGCFLGILALYPAKAPSLALAASILTPLKFSLILVLLFAVAALGIWRVLSRRAA